MTVTTRRVPTRPTLAPTARTMAAALARRAELLAAPLDDAAVRELLVGWNNTTYLLLYLDANDEFVDASALVDLRRRLHDDPRELRRLRDALDGARCRDPETERGRGAFVALLSERLSGARADAERVVDAALDQVGSVLAEVDRAGRALVARLGAPADETLSAQAALVRLGAVAPRPETRGKLARAWRGLQDRAGGGAGEVVDRAVAARHRLAGELGYASAAEATFERCGVTPAQAEAFLADCLEGAVADLAALAADLRPLTGQVTEPLDHLPFARRALARGVRLPRFPVAAVARLAFDVAREHLGVDCAWAPAAGRCQEPVTVSRDGVPLGEIRVDLWRLDGAEPPAPADGGPPPGPTGLPLAHVACRHVVDGEGDDGRLMSLDDVHTFLHEFGHALNHLLLRRRRPSDGGLDYLPLERLDLLSMWCERWAFHPALGACLPAGRRDEAALETARTVKLLELRGDTVRRAVVAAVDLRVHREPGTGVAEAFGALDRRYGIAAQVPALDVLSALTWPMSRLNPGATFVELWAAAVSAAAFVPLLGERRVRGSAPVPALAAALDPEVAAPPAEAAALFAFNRRPFSHPPAGHPPFGRPPSDRAPSTRPPTDPPPPDRPPLDGRDRDAPGAHG